MCWCCPSFEDCDRKCPRTCITCAWFWLIAGFVGAVTMIATGGVAVRYGMDHYYTPQDLANTQQSALVWCNLTTNVQCPLTPNNTCEVVVQQLVANAVLAVPPSAAATIACSIITRNCNLSDVCVVALSAVVKTYEHELEVFDKDGDGQRHYDYGVALAVIGSVAVGVYLVVFLMTIGPH